MPADAGGNLSRLGCVRWIPPEPCREGAMTTSHVRALSRRAGALLGAGAFLVAGCTAAGGGSGLRADRAGPAHGAVAASSSGHSFAHWATRAPARGSVKHGSGSRI